MKHYQNWLDLQHYSMHLKRLINIKSRASKHLVSLHSQAKKLNFRSKTLYHNQKFSDPPVQQAKDAALTCPISNFDPPIIYQIANTNQQRKIMLKQKRDKIISNYLEKDKENYQIPICSTKQQCLRCAQKQQNMSLKRNSKSNHQINQYSRDHSYSQSKLRFSTKKKSMEFQKKGKKNISAHHASSNRFSEFKKYVSAKTTKKNHSYLIQIKVKQIDHMVNPQSISFWFELKTFDSNIKSSFYNFNDFCNKTIYMSCLYQPKGAINICLKYFRNLEKLAYGQYLLILKDNYVDFQEDISIENKGTLKTIILNIKGKIIERQKKLNKKSKILIQKQIEKRASS